MTNISRAGRWLLLVPVALAFVGLSACREHGLAPSAGSPTRIAAVVPLVASTAVPPPRDDGRLPTGTVPLAYRLALRVDPRATAFSGHVEIDVELTAKTRVVVLHGRGFRIDVADFVVAGRPRLGATATFRSAARGKGGPEELVLTAGEELPKGRATIAIDYEAPFAARLRGIYRVLDGDTPYVFSQFEPTDARQAFPCFDEPSFKTRFTVSITAPDGNVAFTNTPERVRHPAETGFTTFEFQPTEPLPTYLVALSVGPLEVLEGGGSSTKLRLIATRGRGGLGRLALDTAERQLPLLERYFRTAYPYPKLDLVAVPNFSAGAMENPGLITFREERLLVDPATASVSSRSSLYGVLAHEMSHLWFGDLVTMKWWDDIWLNEGFATWSATRTLDEWRPELGAGEDSVLDAARAMRTDTLSSARRIREPVRSTTEALEAFDGITYQKASAVLSMTEEWLGKADFQAGVVGYLAQHRWGGGTADDLFASLAGASKKDVASVMRGFTEQTGVPLLETELVCDGKHAAVRFDEREYAPLGQQASGANGAKFWRMPVCVRYGGPSGTGSVCTLLDGKEKLVSLGDAACPTWLHPNLEEAGYYRSRIPLPMLERLVALPPGTLTKRERLGLLVEARALVESGNLDVTDYFRIAETFRGDTDHAVWAEIADFVDFLSTDAVPESAAPGFARWVRTLAATAGQRFGWERRPGDHENEEMARRSVLWLLGDGGNDPATLTNARAFTSKWLEHPGTVDGDIASVAVPLAAEHGDAALFAALLKRASAPGTPEDRVLAITGLGSFDDPSLVDKTLALMLDGTIRSQDQGYVMRKLFRRKAVRARAFAFVAAHVDELLAKIPSQMAPRIVALVSKGCSPEELTRADELLRPRLGSIEGADRALNQSLELGRRCIAFNARSEAAFNGAR